MKQEESHTVTTTIFRCSSCGKGEKFEAWSKKQKGGRKFNRSFAADIGWRLGALYLCPECNAKTKLPEGE